MIEASYMLAGTFVLAVFWIARSLIFKKPVLVHIRKCRVEDRYDNR